MIIYLLGILINSLIFSYLELNQNKNLKIKDKTVQLILTVAFHYIIYFYIYSTIFFVVLPQYFSFDFILAYIIFLILVLASWIIFDNKCILTILTNKMSNASENSAFRDPFDIINNKYNTVESLSNELSFRDKLYYYFIIFSILTSIFVLLNRKI